MKGRCKLMGKSQKRYVWVDYIKIFAYLLVVFGHLYMSMMAGGWIKETARYYCWPVQTIYTFHVPLFFICSGFLYQSSNKNKEWTLEKHVKNVKRKWLALGVPYFTFSIITLVLKIVFSSEVNNQATPILRTLFIEPIAPYWYLYTLFFLFCIVLYFKDKQLMKKIFVGAVFFKVLYVVWLCNFNLPDIVNKILANLVWFLLGMLISEIYMSKTLIKDWMNVVILGVGLGISWIYYSKPLENNVLQFVIGSCMIFPILYFFMSISPDKEGRFVHKLNQYFMPVYVLHTIIAAMLRSILLKIGIANFLLHFSIELIASILIPIVIYEIASKNWILLFWFEPVKALKMKRKKNEN